MSRNWDDLPPLASDEELVEWGKELIAPESRPRPSRPNRPLVAARVSSTISTEELFIDISDRARKAFRVRQRSTVSPRR